MSKNWCYSKSFSQQLKGFLIINRLIKDFILFNSINYRTYNVRKFFNKTAIKILKPYKYLNVIDADYDLLILNNFHLLGVYIDAFNKDDQSWVTDFGSVEFAFVDICF